MDSRADYHRTALDLARQLQSSNPRDAEWRRDFAFVQRAVDLLSSDPA